MPFRRTRGKWALLALSIGLNLFLAGWIATQELAPFHHDRYATPPEKVTETIVRHLPAGDGEIMRHAIEGRMPQIKIAHREAADATNNLKQVAAAQNVDPTALKTAFDAMRSARQAERTLFIDAILEAMPQMTQQGRQDFINDMGRH